MKMRKILLSLPIIIIIIAIVFVGYLRNKQREEKEKIFQEGKQMAPSPIPFQKDLKLGSETSSLSIPKGEDSSKQQPTPDHLLFKEKYLYLDLLYPLLYVYDPKEGIIKYLDLENESYKEIYKIFNLKKAFLSPDKEKMILETERGFQLLDLKNDTLENLPPIVKNFAFSAKGLILYLNNNKSVSYLAYFRDGKTIKIRDLGLLTPEIVPFKNSLLIYEKESPVFILDLTKPDNLKIFLEERKNASILVNKAQDLIFISFKENGWQSEILDQNKKIKTSFSWGTVKEKCSFDEVLVCALPRDLENFDPEAWRLFEPYYDEKLIIYDPPKNEIKEIKLESKFDVFRPKLTPLGIIFWNRLDAKFYLIKPEETSL